MVVFTCNHCGESLKKNSVEKHAFRCRQAISVSCMDCFKDFDRESYNAHVTCITEAERYSGKDYVPKANQNKGQKKQVAWVDMVRSISEKPGLSQEVKNILQTISSYDNIPRKKAKFLNFMKNSFRFMKMNELEQAWCLLEEAMKEIKEENQQKHTNGKEQESKKRKLDAAEGETNSKRPKIEEPADSQNSNNESEESAKFSWSETIRNILQKNNEINLKKLKKKVLKQYKMFSGSDVSDKIENKFSKKLNKLKGVAVDNERVRLIAT